MQAFTRKNILSLFLHNKNSLVKAQAQPWTIYKLTIFLLSILTRPNIEQIH